MCKHDGYNAKKTFHVLERKHFRSGTFRKASEILDKNVFKTDIVLKAFKNRKYGGFVRQIVSDQVTEISFS